MGLWKGNPQVSCFYLEDFSSLFSEREKKMEIPTQLGKQGSWIFADNMNVGDKIQVSFKEYEQRKSINGIEYPVFVFDKSGTEVCLSVWRTEYVKVEELLGTDTDKWKGKIFVIEKQQINGKDKLALYPLPEETI